MEQEFEDFEDFESHSEANNKTNKVEVTQEEIDFYMREPEKKKINFHKYMNGLSSILPMQYRAKKDDEFIFEVSGRNDCPNVRIPGFENMPEDLRDEESFWIMTRDGYPTVGKVLPEEIAQGRRSPGLTIYLGLAMFIPLLFIMLGLYSLPIIVFYYFFLTLYTKHALQYIAIGIGGMVSYYYALNTGNVIFAHIFTAIPALYLVWFAWVDKQIKADVLEHLGKIPFAPSPFTKPDDAKFKQTKRAMKDKGLLIPYGITLGYLAQFGYPYAPDTGKTLGMTCNDLSTHLIVFGETGSGKTSAFINPILKGILYEEKITHTNIGVLLLDGKGTLAQKCKKALNVVLNPSLVKRFNILQGQTPSIFSNTLWTLNIGPNDKEQVWSSAAKSMLFYGSVIHDELVKLGTHKFNFSTRVDIINQMCSRDDKVRRQFLQMMEDVKDNPRFDSVANVLMDALNKYEYEYSVMAPETLSSVQFNVQNWLSPFLQSEKLRYWADCEESDVDIEDILRYGIKIGLLLPEIEFGAAGVAYASLIKARYYNLIGLRGDLGTEQSKNFVKERGYKKEYTAFLIVDEAQIIADSKDVDMASVGRSYGLRIVMATQNIEGLYEKFGKDKTLQFLGNMVSKVCFNSTKETLDYMADCMGKSTKYLEYAGNNDKANNFSLGMTALKELSLSKYDSSNKNFGFFTKSRYERREMFYGERIDEAKNKIKNHCGVSGYAEQAAILDGRALQLLQKPEIAFAMVKRAGALRYDFIRVGKVDGNFKDVIE